MRGMMFGALALLASVAPAGAVSVRDCNDDLATAAARNIAEPWEKNTRTFYKGDVRVALLDTGGEPVCCSLHLLILSPSGEDPGDYRACHVVGDHEGLGFVNIGLDRMRARYDDAQGLLLTFPYEIYVDGVAPNKTGTARIRINAATGAVSVEP